MRTTVSSLCDHCHPRRRKCVNVLAIVMAVVVIVVAAAALVPHMRIHREEECTLALWPAWVDAACCS